jgi:hypothetical protein
MKTETIGKAILKNGKWTFEKEFWGQGEVYKYLGDLNDVDDDYPIYSAEYQENEYETKSTLKKLCKGSKVDWEILFDLLDWQHADGLFYELDEIHWFFGDNKK